LNDYWINTFFFITKLPKNNVDYLGDLVPYNAAKHSILGITKNIAFQYSAKNIRDNAICLYYVVMPLLSAVPAEAHKAWVEGTWAKRLCTPEELS
jgi:NAD(P)-dependent dehydrogenase (short-subunit alcohol dehydrogenase family)